MTTHTAPRRQPLRALVQAEYRQFRRNKTLVYLGTVFPIAVPLFTLVVGRRSGDPGATVTALTLEMFALMALLFVQYYSVLSMVTTRRGEGVLKRLRTGEASDRQILTAPAVPGAILTLVTGLAVAAIVYAMGAPAPVNPGAMLIALLGGIVVFSLLALATSAVTKNAEAAQITSLPVMVVAMLGLGVIRDVLPERLAELAEWTPFAAVSDLMSLGAVGKLATAPESAGALDLAGTLGQVAQPLATLALWSVLALVLIRRAFRWDDRG